MAAEAGDANATETPPMESPVAAAAAEAAIDLRVVWVGGEDMLRVDNARPEWRVADVLAEMEAAVAAPPHGHHYVLLHGERRLKIRETLASLPAAAGAEDAAAARRVVLVAVVTRDDGAQRELDLALIKAATTVDVPRVHELLAEGASAKYVDAPEGVWGSRNQRSALHMALLAGRGDANEWRAVVTALLEAGADVNATRAESDWRGCGHSCTAFEMVLPLAMEDAELLQQFLAAGADPNTVSEVEVHSMRTDGSKKHTVLNTAARQGNVAIARTLLDARADVNSVAFERMDNERGFNTHVEETSLHIAVCKGDIAMAQLLVARGANVNSARIDLLQEQVPIAEQIAERRRRLEEVKAMCDEGEVAELSDEEELTNDPRSDFYVSPVRSVPVTETPLHIAIKGGHHSIVALLACAGADAALVYKKGEVNTPTEELCQGNEELLAALHARGPFESEQLPADEEAMPVHERGQ